MPQAFLQAIVVPLRSLGTRSLSDILESAQEIDDLLLLLSAQSIEVFDDLIRFAAVALMGPDGLNQVGRSSIMEEEDALSDAPERSGAKFVGPCASLSDGVSEAFAHVVDDEVREKIRHLIGERGAGAGRRSAGNLWAGGQ